MEQQHGIVCTSPRASGPLKDLIFTLFGLGTVGGFWAEEWHDPGYSELDHYGWCDKKIIVGQKRKWRTVATAMIWARDDGGLVSQKSGKVESQSPTVLTNWRGQISLLFYCPQCLTSISWVQLSSNAISGLRLCLEVAVWGKRFEGKFWFRKPRLASFSRLDIRVLSWSQMSLCS